MGREKDTSKSTILKEIRDAEDCIKSCFHRIEVIERNLKDRHMSDEERERLEKELEEVKKLLTHNEGELKNLHRENSKTFVVAVLLMFFSFLFYGVYRMLYGF